MKNLTIEKVIGREIIDSRGNPTVEAEVYLADGTIGRGTAPSGASTGEFEALELRDNDKERFGGKGVTKAVANINTVINEALKGKDASDIYAVDAAMKAADGTKDKSNLGANAILAVSIASCRAAAKALEITLYSFLGCVNEAAVTSTGEKAGGIAALPPTALAAAPSIGTVSSTRSFPKQSVVRADPFQESVSTDVQSDADWGGIETVAG